MIETLGDALRSNAHKRPNEIALIYAGRRVTFGEHHVRAQKLAHALHSAGLRQQDRIAVLSQNSAAYLEIFATGELAGYVVATVNFRLAAPEIGYILGDSAPEILFFEAQYAGAIAALRQTLPSIRCYVCIGDALDWAIGYEDFLESGSSDGAPFQARGDDIMHLIYTSGTTARPKGVMRTHRAEIGMAEFMTSEVGVLAGDRVQIMMPLFHVGARWLQLGAHLRGASVILHREFEPDEVLATIAREGVTVTHMAPTIVQRVFDHPLADSTDLSTLRTVYYSAAPMPLSLLRRVLTRLGPVFVQLYGMTEGFGTTLHKDQHVPDGRPEQIRRLASVGQAPAGVGIRILNDAHQDQPVGQPGEVVIHTDTRMLGYWNNSVATAAALRDGWYYSGDLGYLDEEGYLFLVDRKKDMIISGGENIYCREVEEAIAAHPGVADVAVIGVPDPEWGEAVRALIVKAPGAALTEAEIVQHCRELIASYKKPRSVVFLDELPRLTTGKVNKVLLRTLHRNGVLGPRT
jgi:acyl-CoA synthetase (AMP-forming)/AMP-acid ligase II